MPIQAKTIGQLASRLRYDGQNFALEVQPQLERHLQNLLERHPGWEVEDVWNHFHHLALAAETESDRQQGREHLIALLEVARRDTIVSFCQKYADLLDLDLDSVYDLSSRPLESETFERLLDEYNPNHPSKASLEAYFRGVFWNSIRSRYRFESDWHLLCNQSDRKAANRLRAALRAQGEPEQQISWYVFAWQLFTEIYRELLSDPERKSGTRWPQPPAEQLQKAAEEFNRYRYAPDVPRELASPKLADLSRDRLENWLQQCIRALRQYDPDRAPEARATAPDSTRFFQDFDRYLEIWTDEIESQLQTGDLTYRSQGASRANCLGVMPLCLRHPLQLITQERYCERLFSEAINYPIARFITRVYQQPLRTRLQRFLTEVGYNREWARQCCEEFCQNFDRPAAELSEVGKLAASLFERESKERQRLVRTVCGGRIEDILGDPSFGLRHRDFVIEEMALFKRDLSLRLLSTVEQQLVDDYIKKWLQRRYAQVVAAELERANAALSAHLPPADRVEALGRALETWAETRFAIPLDRQSARVQKAIAKWIEAYT